jgi:hypothetical protein
VQFPSDTSEHPLAEFTSELEALDQPVADLLVPRLALVTGEALAKAPYGIAEWGCVELHPTTFGPLVSRMVLHIVSEVFRNARDRATLIRQMRFPPRLEALSGRYQVTCHS